MRSARKKQPAIRLQPRRNLSKLLKLIRPTSTKRSVSLIKRKSRSVRLNSKLQQLMLELKKASRKR